MTTISQNFYAVTGALIPQSSNDTVGGPKKFKCVNSDIWIQKDFQEQDCMAAIDELYLDAQSRDSQAYEFLSYGTKRGSRLPPMYTPRKYTVGKFTKSVVRKAERT